MTSLGHSRVPSTRLRSVLVVTGLALISFVIGNVVVLTVATALEAVGFRVYGRPAVILFLSVVLLQGVTFGGVALAYLKHRELGWRFIRVEVPSLRDLAVTVGGFLLLVLLLVVASGVLSSLGIESAQNQIVTIGNRNPVVFLLLVPLSFLLVGPGEELLFRGIIQGTLEESFHAVWAIILASALFASVHLFSLTGQGKLVYIGVVFALALVLGSTYVYTDNLVVPALIHGAYNAVQFGGAYLAATSGV